MTAGPAGPSLDQDVAVPQSAKEEIQQLGHNLTMERGVCITDSLQWINHLKLVISNNSRRAALLRWMGQDLPAELRTPNDGVCIPSVACFHQGRRSDRS